MHEKEPWRHSHLFPITQHAEQLNMTTCVQIIDPLNKIKLTWYHKYAHNWLSCQLHDCTNYVPVGRLQRLHRPSPRHGSLGHHQLNVLLLHTSLIDSFIVILGRCGDLWLWQDAARLVPWTALQPVSAAVSSGPQSWPPQRSRRCLMQGSWRHLVWRWQRASRNGTTVNKNLTNVKPKKKQDLLFVSYTAYILALLDSYTAYTSDRLHAKLQHGLPALFLTAALLRSPTSINSCSLKSLEFWVTNRKISHG